jgi:hypothetical protein
MPPSDKLFDVIERVGIIGPQGLLKIQTMPAKEITKLYGEIWQTIFDAQNARAARADSAAPRDPFAFHASASIRGDSGCSSVECRGNKISFLARYAALYANELIFPLSLRAPGNIQGVFDIRHLLGENLFTLFLLRPLITEGIVHPVVMRTQHCVHHAELAEMTKNIVHDFSQFTAKQVLGEFRMTYELPEKSPSGQPTIYLYGPEEFIEHGGLAKQLEKPPTWLPRTARFDKDGQTEIRGPAKQFMVTEIFADFADNVAFYLSYGGRRNARFLSDMPGETDFLDWLTDDDKMTAKSRALEELEHSVPVLAELPVATILRIRREERESFQAYREAIGTISANIMAANNRITKKEAREMFRSAIEPQLIKMKKEMVANRKSQGRRMVAGVASVMAAVAIGAYSGLPPLVSVPLVAAGTFVGQRLLGKAAEVACEHGPEMAQKNDLYFLLRLTQEAGA